MKVFSYQKNTDLHALSAGTTIMNFLKCDAIKRCRRYVYWDIDVDCADEKQWIESIVAKTYYLLNTNKEDYYVSSLPSVNKEGAFHILVEVQNTLFEDQSDLIAKINNKCQTNIKHIKKSLLWDLLVEASSYEQAEDYVKTQLLDGHSHPFLLNPIFEQSSILKPATIIQK